MPSIRFNHVNNPDYVLIHEINDSFLPEVNINTLAINGRVGEHRFSKNIGMREITVSMSIVGDDEADVKNKARMVANFWLHSDGPVRFINLDEPNRYYLAEVRDAGELTQKLTIGKAVVTFVCTDPHAYDVEESVISYDALPANGAMTFVNAGKDVFPSFKMTFTRDTDEFALITQGRHLLFRQPAEGSLETDLVLNEPMFALDNWTLANAPSDATTAGNFTTDADGAFVAGSDFGQSEEAHGWRGPSMRRSLSAGTRDFTLTCDVEFSQHVALNQGNQGRIQVFLENDSGQTIGSLTLEDVSSEAFMPRFSALAGEGRIVNNVTNPSAWGRVSENIRGISRGRMEISRINHVWTASFGILNPAGQLEHVSSGQLNLSTEVNLSSLTHIKIHIGAHDNHTPIGNMRFRRIQVRQQGELNNATLSPYVFNAGDVLEIDGETGVILRNGARFYEFLEPSSQFLKFSHGFNAVVGSPRNVVGNASMRLRRRWF